MLPVREQVPLAPLTTLRVGGPARYFAEITEVEQAGEAFAWASERGLPVFVLGGGSNLLVADEGFEGLVLRMALAGVRAEGDGVYSVAGGEDWDALVARTVDEGASGMECLSGIPGTCGAAPIQNIGAYGQEVAETIREVRCFDRRSGRVVTLGSAECGFAYRTSIFNSKERERYVVLGVTFALHPGGEPSLRYADLQRHFSGNGRPSLGEVRRAVLEIRASKGMVLRAEDPDSRSAGSFFKNPVLRAEEYAGLKERLEVEGKSCPVFPAAEGQVKLSAAWLIERAGFARGWGEGRAGISTKHTLALVNRGGATAGEIVALAQRVQAGVRERFGVGLSPEPVLLGFAGAGVLTS